MHINDSVNVSINNKLEYEKYNQISDAESTTCSEATTYYGNISLVDSNRISESTYWVDSDRTDLYFDGSGDDVLIVGEDIEYPIELSKTDNGSLSRIAVIGINPSPSVISKIIAPPGGNVIDIGIWSVFVTAHGLNEHVNPRIYLNVIEVDIENNIVHTISDCSRESTVEVSDLRVYQLDAHITKRRVLQNDDNRVILEIYAVSNDRTDLEISIGGGHTGILRIPVSHSHVETSQPPTDLGSTSMAFADALRKSISYAASEFMRILKKCISDPLFDGWKYLVELFKYICDWLFTTFRREERVIECDVDADEIDSDVETDVVGYEPEEPLDFTESITREVPTLNTSNGSCCDDIALLNSVIKVDPDTSDVYILQQLIMNGDAVIKGNLIVEGTTSSKPNFIDVNIDEETTLPSDFRVINISSNAPEIITDRVTIHIHDKTINGSSHKIVNNTGRDITILNVDGSEIIQIYIDNHTEIFYVDGWRVG